jgi:bifunctional DNA-binding transcriptional regulator/antitoxin component of YhaV-PrlF toxin-antitoxin module
MPSLSPGTPGAKEAYGISIIREDYSICIPPKALKRYNIANDDIVLLTSTRKGEGGLAILNYEKAKQSVFNEIINKIKDINLLVYERSRPYALTNVLNDRIILNQEFIDAFNLKIGDKLVVIKSTTVSMSFSPIEIWKEKFKKRGFLDAIRNIDKLEIY